MRHRVVFAEQTIDRLERQLLSLEGRIDWVGSAFSSLF
jgi:hypothetical protein